MTDAAAAALREIADRVLEWRRGREPALRIDAGLPVERLPSVTLADAEESARFSAAMLARLDALDGAVLSPSETAFLGTLRFDLENRRDALAHYWLDFLVTPYRGGDIHVAVRAALSAQKLATPDDLQRYERLLHDYARLLDEIAAKIREQRRRGILLARAALPMARRAVNGVADGLETALVPAASAAFQQKIRELIAVVVRPRVLALGELLDASYEAAAPDSAGLGGYPGGAEYYRFLIRERADTDLAPEQIHVLGRAAVRQLSLRRAALRATLAPGMTEEEFHLQLRTDPRWIATTPGQVEERYRGYMAKIEPAIAAWVGRLPAAPCMARRCDPATESGMTYGYYQRPTTADPVGYYRFNGTGLSERSLIGAQHLIYHELLPGHHLQISLQAEHQAVHPLQAFLHSMAYVEGWAVYASELAREMQLYDPYDLYGHYQMQSFLAARLVVDTGLNALGWSLEQARAFLRLHTSEGPQQIDSEVLRYATDIPAQALAYDLGRYRIEELRRSAEARLGADFDIRAFHDAVLDVGGVPLPVLAARIEAFVAAHARA